MQGLYNKILRIDVGSKTFEQETIPEEISHRYLGGKGIATHILLEENPPAVDPLSPENLLILAIGPFSGSGIWGSCRYGIYTKSPLTGYYSESYSGGTTAEYMAKTGFDLFVLKGTAPNPVWIEIAEDVVHFHPAEDLWGLGTYETEDRIKQWIMEAGLSRIISELDSSKNQIGSTTLKGLESTSYITALGIAYNF